MASPCLLGSNGSNIRAVVWSCRCLHPIFSLKVWSESSLASQLDVITIQLSASQLPVIIDEYLCTSSEYFEIDALFDGKPVESVKNGGYVFTGPGVSKEVSSRVLEGMRGDASEEGVAVVKT